MTVAEQVVHQARIVRRNSFPGMPTFQFVCSCSAASPEAHNKDVALIAKRAHLREIGAEVDDA